MVVIDRGRTAEDEVAPGVEANARLTGSTAAVLLILLAVEGVTILEVSNLGWVQLYRPPRSSSRSVRNDKRCDVHAVKSLTSEAGLRERETNRCSSVLCPERHSAPEAHGRRTRGLAPVHSDVG